MSMSETRMSDLRMDNEVRKPARMSGLLPRARRSSSGSWTGRPRESGTGRPRGSGTGRAWGSGTGRAWDSGTAARAAAPIRAGWMVALLVVVALWQHPVGVKEIRDAGDPMASPEFFAPLLAEIERRRPAGRVEVVPTYRYWEAAYVPATVPLARGWLRQADTARNPVFFGERLSSGGYRRWLRDNAVSLVAVADAPVAPVGRSEAALIRTGPAYLRRVWRNQDWTLYAFTGAVPLAEGLVAADEREVTVDVPAARDVLVRVRWSRWLTVRGPAACLEETADGWTTLRVTTPGRYTLTGGLRPGPRC